MSKSKDMPPSASALTRTNSMARAIRRRMKQITESHTTAQQANTLPTTFSRIT
jgi:hypothetical protein